MVTHAERAHVGEAAATAGSTIYEGDRLSTDEGGTLRMTIPALTLHLNEQTTLVVRSLASPGGDIEARLASGTLVFSAARTGNVVVAANDALIRRAASVPTTAHIRVVNPQELRIYAQRGALEFSYHGESEVIAEGTAYRVLLDPSEKEVAAVSESEEAKKKRRRRHTKFLLLMIGIAAGVAIPVLMPHYESPDRPGPPSSPK